MSAGRLSMPVHLWWVLVVVTAVGIVLGAGPLYALWAWGWP